MTPPMMAPIFKRCFLLGNDVLVGVSLGRSDAGVLLSSGDELSLDSVLDELGVTVVRVDRVVGMTVEPLDTDVVCRTRLVKGEVA